MRKIQKISILFTTALVVTITSGEIFSRYYLGLGTPPLSIAHPTIEYMFKPNQDVYRFGNHIIINQYGMRTAPFSVDETDDELRIMVFGDSVLNGGNLTDHADLATTFLQEKLNQTQKQKVVVGNISAGSWGPGNWLAYAKEYGFFGADVVVLVISSHDYADNPSFSDLNQNTHPTRYPILALVEGVTRYLPRYLPHLKTNQVNSESDKFSEQINEQEGLRGLKYLRSFLQLSLEHSSNILVLQHWEKEEIERGFPKHGGQRIKELCQSMEITPVSLEPYFSHSIENGKNPYRDNIHLNQIEQKIIAQVIFDNLPKKVLMQSPE
ncbi:hypothetical protein [Trichothermofontia sp.]